MNLPKHLTPDEKARYMAFLEAGYSYEQIRQSFVDDLTTVQFMITQIMSDETLIDVLAGTYHQRYLDMKSAAHVEPELPFNQ